MQSLFFYGTLCHVPLLETVLGRDATQIDMIAARLPDHCVTWVKDEAFPMIAAQEGAVAEGLLVSNLSDADIARLRFYEGGFEYDLARVDVETSRGRVPARVFFPEPGLWTPGAAWDLSGWLSRWGATSLNTAQEVMSQFGLRTAAQMAHLLPFLRARGWARVLAGEGARADLRRATETQDVEYTLQDGSDGFFRLQSFDISYPRFDGVKSPTVRRSAFVAYDAALVLPYDPVSDQVMLVEQLRYGPLLRGDPRPWVLEPIAGLVDAGEEPIETARREALEEAGLALSDIRPMLVSYASPGYSTEYFHCFLGICALDAAQAGLGGLEAENEDIRSHVIGFDRAMGLLDSGEITGGPMAMMLLWLARARAGLRG